MSAESLPATRKPQPATFTDRTSEFVMDGCDAVESCVQKHPMATVLTCFGVAFGVGLLLGNALGEPLQRPESYSERWRRRFQDSLSSLPESISKHLPR